MTGKCAQFCVFFLMVLNILNDANAQLKIVTKSISFEKHIDSWVVVNNTSKHVYNLTYPAVSLRTGPARISVESVSVHVDSPIIVVVWNDKGVMSWQIPHREGNATYTKVSRIICPKDNYNMSTSVTAKVDHVYVSLTTAGKRNIAVRLQVNTNDVTNFFLRPGKTFMVPPSDQLDFTPSEPWYYQFNWPGTNVTSVLLRVDSRTGQNICMTLSIQHISCPVLDTERTVGYDGYWQTIDRKGGVTISKDSFPNGFYVVFILNGDDAKCSGANEIKSGVRRKTISFALTETIGKEKYYVAVLMPLAVYAVVCLLFVTGAVIFACRPFPNSWANSIGTVLAQTSRKLTLESEELKKSGIERMARRCAEEQISDGTTDNTASPTDATRNKNSLCVCDLAKKPPKKLRKETKMYAAQLFTVAVFYALPVVQLMISYQTMLLKTGNQDRCFYNFLCSHPLYITDTITISDFNHVFSNCGYIILGLLFCAWTFRRDKMHRNRVKDCPVLDQEYGIPQHYGFFYAIGFALVMEGFLSASYHICPNRTNFQFDTSFMYVMAVLCMVKLYHNRHPDINASANKTFMALALIIFFGMIGIIESSDGFFIFMSVIHLYKRLLERIKSMPKDVADHPREYLTPKYPNRFVLLTIGIVMNAMLVFVGWSYGLKKNFGSYLLTVLLANLMFYFFFYIIMKLINGEKLRFQPLVYSILSVSLAAPACYFFYATVTSWQDTPAVSRHVNMQCLKPLDFYDCHDMWHFLSAGGLFFMFMVLLTLDDDLLAVHRSKIPAF